MVGCAPLTPLTAVAVVRRFVPEHAATIHCDRRLTDADQWTLQGVIRNTRPFHRIALGDQGGTEYYVSGANRGAGAATNVSWAVLWAYTSAVLHWLYFTPLRRQDAFWSAFVARTRSSGFRWRQVLVREEVNPVHQAWICSPAYIAS